MKLGLHIDDYTWSPGNGSVADVLARVAKAADAGGLALSNDGETAERRLKA